MSVDRDAEFSPWLGDIADQRTLRARCIIASNRYGRKSFRSAMKPTFYGNRIGRGSGVGRVLFAAHPNAIKGVAATVRTRKVRVMPRITHLNRFGGAKDIARGHIRYLKRDGTARDGGSATPYGERDDEVDTAAFLKRSKLDRHQFRLVVQAEDAVEYEDLKPFIRRLLTQIERDLRTELDWVAADHFDTENPHTHIVIRGRRSTGQDLIVAKEYLDHGLSIRAAELASLDLGPRTDAESVRMAERNLAIERVIDVDHALLAEANGASMVSSIHPDIWQQSLRAGRLRTLQHMGLAEPVGRALWRLDPEFINTLNAMEKRNGASAELALEVQRLGLKTLPSDLASVSGSELQNLVGRVVSAKRNEHDQLKMLIDGIDGRLHVIEGPIGLNQATLGAIVSLSPKDRGIGQAIETKERDSLRPFTVESEHSATFAILSCRPLEQQLRYDGNTWLDRYLTTNASTPAAAGFGGEVRLALAQRSQWLVEQNLAEPSNNGLRFRSDLLAVLDARDLQSAAMRLEKELGLPWSGVTNPSDHASWQAKVVNVGDQVFALLERPGSFSLVPWEPDTRRPPRRREADLDHLQDRAD